MTLSSCGGNVLTVSCANHFLFAWRQNDENRLEHNWLSSSENNFGSFLARGVHGCSLREGQWAILWGNRVADQKENSFDDVVRCVFCAIKLQNIVTLVRQFLTYSIRNTCFPICSVMSWPVHYNMTTVCVMCVCVCVCVCTRQPYMPVQSYS